MIRISITRENLYESAIGNAKRKAIVNEQKLSNCEQKFKVQILQYSISMIGCNPKIGLN